MFGLLATVITTLGATGMGSVLKMVSGAFDSRAHANELKEKREMLREIERGKMDLEFAKAVFGADQEAQRDGRRTRRAVALIWVSVCSLIAFLGAFDPTIPLTTFTLPEMRQPFVVLWGLFSVPSGAATTVEITTGHLAIVAMAQNGLVIGFFFTPGGRK